MESFPLRHVLTIYFNENTVEKSLEIGVLL